ncbi:hypothetical protein [Marinilabilia sp.]|uniref:hypothetical protein n=1 Tax=Marinilabilia sp. TaxID=2021252 RepID=UPI0025BCB144|nr:hypothetical protein [Marinilabilia sp.]
MFLGLPGKVSPYLASLWVQNINFGQDLPEIKIEGINSNLLCYTGIRNSGKERLLNAFMSFHSLKENDFPDDLKSKWKELNEKLKSEQPTTDFNGEVVSGRVENTLNKLTIEECNEVAKIIVDLSFQIRRND